MKHWKMSRSKTISSSNVAEDDGDIAMDTNGRTQSAISPPAKTTFSVKGATFRIDPRYSFTKLLGVGSYGVVCAGKDSVTGKGVAIKKVAAVFDDLTDAKRIIREIRLLCAMKHENILRILDIDEPEHYMGFNDVYICTELLDTDLHKLLRSKHVLLDSQKKYFVYQLLRACKYLHSANILHRDLKPANILVAENCDLRICDFGLARYCDPSEESPNTCYVVTRWYRSPELLLASDDYATAIDMWSVGCILAEMYTRRPIFPGKDTRNQVELICKVIGKPTSAEIDSVRNKRAREFLKSLAPSRCVDWAKALPEADETARDLISRLLVFDPKKRLTAQEALEHPCVADYRDRSSETVADSSVCLEDLEPPNEKKIGSGGIRRLMWDEMLRFHPEAAQREPPEAAEAHQRIVAFLKSKKG
eukprot:Plantae.Rhodophyta-Hildenbrandia_rubra.ctg26383.p1 GENE.Plantae.Rhodophyta-Hildenbrandia_rubra.ctg26383~~Plantae.Rhodophyta-Hildenbrandia_rubra.ctg26383.p1  ORF type:complete len:419 (+),score=84.99 Plantae.Rhodophyta-Hildenbrandia_rubra.ctg26383:826-2082(+)